MTFLQARDARLAAYDAYCDAVGTDARRAAYEAYEAAYAAEDAVRVRLSGADVMARRLFAS